MKERAVRGFEGRVGGQWGSGKTMRCACGLNRVLMLQLAARPAEEECDGDGGTSSCLVDYFQEREVS